MYKNKKCFIEITAPEEKGIATIWDYDILLYCTTKIVDSRNKHLPIKAKLQIPTYDLLTFTRRGVSGRSYQRLEQSLDRLLKTSITTNLRMEDQTEVNTRKSGFHWINSYDYVRNEKNGKIKALQIELNNWTFKGICADNILRSTTEYFSLRKGYERWLYRLIRKHGGKQRAGWEFSMKQLYERSASTNQYSKFAQSIEQIVERQSIPQYRLSLREKEGELCLHFRCIDHGLLVS